MTGPNPECFDRALARFKSNLEPSLWQEFSSCTLQDVHQAIRDIQDNDIKQGSLRALNRLEAFVEAMEQLGTVIEVFLNANELLCFIWGPIKFLLITTRSFFDVFEKLLDMYDRIGEAVHGLIYYKDTFEKHPPLSQVLEDYYCDILNFHKEAIAIFKRSRLKNFFRASWKTYETRFNPIIQSLQRRKELLESEKGSATLHSIQSLRESVAQVQQEQTEQARFSASERHRRLVLDIQDKLQSPNYEIDQEISTEDRGGGKSGEWIFQDPRFQVWLNGDTSDGQILYINGIPGAGKTTLTSAMIERLLRDKVAPDGHSFVGYFYFKHQQNDTHNSMLRALLSQFIKQCPTISNHLSSETEHYTGASLRTNSKLESLVLTAVESYTTSYIVLDGLDECSSLESVKTLDWLFRLADAKLKDSQSNLRVIISGQRDGILDSKLAAWPSISLEDSAHNGDIRNYCQQTCEHIIAKFFKSSSLADEAQKIRQEIISLVMREAKGMFLYARVVLQNLLGQTRLSGLKREIRTDVFPRGIENAYNRVLVRITEQSSPAEREDAVKLLGLVVHARRMLHWREIQGFFCINPADGVIDSDNRLLVTCKDLCSSLVDTCHSSRDLHESEHLVRIVHETARMYLLKKHCNLFLAERINLPVFCLQYLTSKPFEASADVSEVNTAAQNGYFALQDYTVQYWYDHTSDCLHLCNVLDSEQRDRLLGLIGRLFSSHSKDSKRDWVDDKANSSHIADRFNQLPESGRERNEYFNLDFRTALIRQRIEELRVDVSSVEKRTIFDFFYGRDTMFKCSKPWCDKFKGGLESTQERQRHINRHELPFTCSKGQCHLSNLGFDSSSALDHHQKTWHSENETIQFLKKQEKSEPIPKNIIDAARCGNVEAVEGFLDDGVSPNVTTDESPLKGIISGSPLSYAAGNGHLKVCQVLVERGADVNLSPMRGSRSTALHRSVSSRCARTTQFLLAQDNIQVEKKNDHRLTAFSLLREPGALFRKVLAASGKFHADLVEVYNRSPLFEDACSSGDAIWIKYLLEHGFGKYLEQECILCALRSGVDPSLVGDIIGLILSLGRVRLGQDEILDAMKRNFVSIAGRMIHYPRTDFTNGDLIECREMARGKRFTDLSEKLDEILQQRLSSARMKLDEISHVVKTQRASRQEQGFLIKEPILSDMLDRAQDAYSVLGRVQSGLVDWYYYTKDDKRATEFFRMRLQLEEFLQSRTEAPDKSTTQVKANISNSELQIIGPFLTELEVIMRQSGIYLFNDLAGPI